MKIITLLLLLATISASAQYRKHKSDAYVDFSVDGNKLLQVVDNPRTEIDHKGLDFDLELGARDRKVGVYLFYGRFDAADYQNYGAGVDYYVAKGDWYDIAVGPSLSVVMRKYYTGVDFDRPGWGAAIGWATRVTGTFWVFPQFGVSGRFQYQRRPDIAVHGIIEGSIGIKFKFAER